MDFSVTSVPAIVHDLQAKCEDIGFTMPSDLHIGSFLRSMCISKVNGHFLELGTGIGLSLAWMVDGLRGKASVISVDNDEQLIEIAMQYFGTQETVELVCADGSEWIMQYDGEKFDIIFADAWPGKYSELDETLALLKVGGLYIIDDMKSQPNWPEGHEDKVNSLVSTLALRKDLVITKFDWSTGVIMAVKMK